MNYRGFFPFALYLCPVFWLSCGYHVAGSGTSAILPTSIKTIAVPAFSNVTVRYKLTSYMSEAITREFITRTRYRVVSDPKEADAVLSGSVLSYNSYPTAVDQKTGRPSAIQAIVTMRVTLRDRATGAVLFERPRFEARQYYEIAVDPKAYFDESDAALDRLSREVARSVVSAILENF